MIDIEQKQMKVNTFCKSFDVARSTAELWIHSLWSPAYRLSVHWYVDIPKYNEWREKEHKRSYKYAYPKNNLPNNAEFKVYMALRTLLQTKHSVTLDSLSSYLDLGKSTISEHIKSLEDNGIIKIEKRINERGLFYNYYTFLNFDINSMNQLSK